MVLLTYLHKNKYCSVTHLSRHDAVILRRLRIGHTRVTHKYLLSGDSQPLCDECKCSRTVKHILLECCSLKDIREKYFTCSSLKELFENVDATTIMDFIKKSQFLSSCLTIFVIVFHITLAVGACFYLAFHIIRFYHLTQYLLHNIQLEWHCIA